MRARYLTNKFSRSEINQAVKIQLDEISQGERTVKIFINESEHCEGSN